VFVVPNKNEQFQCNVSAMIISGLSVVEGPKFKQQYCLKKKKKKRKRSLVPAALAYNPSYLGGKDQEDHSTKPGQANSSQDQISKISITEKRWQSDSRCRP
jgi:hypothetical protein